jgi:hypothetical protein
MLPPPSIDPKIPADLDFGPDRPRVGLVYLCVCWDELGSFIASRHEMRTGPRPTPSNKRQNALTSPIEFRIS